MSIQFQSTIWTQIRKAKERDIDALNDFVQRYQEPVKLFLRKKGITQQDAEDITQDVFTTILENRILERADQKKGRFRFLLLAVTNNVLKNFQRKKRSDSQLIDEIIKSGLDLVGSYDDEFDRLWASNIINLAFRRLKDQNLSYYEAIRLFLLEDMDQATIARTLSLTLDQVGHYITRGKAKLIEYISEEIKSYSSSKDEYLEELKCISRFLEQ